MERSMDYYTKISSEILKHNLVYKNDITDCLVNQYLKGEWDQIRMVASGSSLHAAEAAEYFMRRCLKTEVKAVSAGTYERYGEEKAGRTFIIVISQSGCSTNIIRVLKQMEKRGEKRIVLTGNTKSEVKNCSEVLIEYGVGNETVDYVTLGLVTLMEFLMMFALEAGKRLRTLAEGEYEKLTRELETAADLNRAAYEQSVTFFQSHYKEFTSMETVFVCGSGPNLAAAKEGALKFCETVKIPAFAWETEEFIHGPNMQLTPRYTLFFIDGDKRDERTRLIYEAARKVTDRAYFITGKDMGGDDHVCFIGGSGQVDDHVYPLFTVVLFQYLAFHVTTALNRWKVHPLFHEFEKAVSCKTENYKEIMQKKEEEAKKEEKTKNEEGVGVI